MPVQAYHYGALAMTELSRSSTSTMLPHPHFLQGEAAKRPRRARSIYLASGLGFSDRQRALVLPELVSALTSLGLDVHEPFEDTGEGAKMAHSQERGWAYRVGQSDFKVYKHHSIARS